MQAQARPVTDHAQRDRRCVLTGSERVAVRAAVESAIGRPVHLRDALDLALSILPASNLGMIALAGDGTLVLARQGVRPVLTENRDPEDYLLQLGDFIAWNHAADLVEAVGQSIGRAAFDEFYGERVPDDAGYAIETPGERVCAQIRYQSDLLGDCLQDTLETILTADGVIAEMLTASLGRQQ